MPLTIALPLAAAPTISIMDISTEYIKKRFDEFNRLCFDGSLPQPTFRLSNVKTYLGQMRRQQLPSPWEHRHVRYVLTINTRYQLAPREIEDVILHEMIHYYIMVNGIGDTSAHGPHFRHIMDRINRQYGRDISISSRAAHLTDDRPQHRRWQVLCLIRFSSDSLGVICPALTRLSDICRQLQRTPGISSCQWYQSDDPFFDRYPRSRSLRVFRITEAEAHAHLSSAHTMQKVGNQLRVID